MLVHNNEQDYRKTKTNNSLMSFTSASTRTDDVDAFDGVFRVKIGSVLATSGYVYQCISIYIYITNYELQLN